MRRWIVVALIPAVLGGGALSAAPEASPQGKRPSQGPTAWPAQPGHVRKPDLSRPDQWVPGQVLVQWSPGVGRAEARAEHARRGARVVSRIRGFGGIDVVELPPGLSVREGVARYERDPRVEAAEPNLLRPVLGHVANPETNPRFGQLWGLENIGQPHPLSRSSLQRAGTPGADIAARAAWEQEHGEELGPIVAVVDSGVNIAHPDLVGQLWENPDPGGANSMGCGNDVHGCNFGSGHPQNLSDAANHGTHVAGTIAAAHNDIGVVGVCPQCRIMVLKFDETLAAELQALDYARRNGARIVNGSFGGPIWSKLERRAIRRLHRAGILAVFAAGNNALDNDVAAGGPGGRVSPLFPASYTLPNILAVAASNHHDRLGYSTACDLRNPRWQCAFTSFGAESVDVAAPGVDIMSTVRSGGYRAFDGTSMAAPHVAGVAGLVLSGRPGLGHMAVKNAIMNSVDRPASLRRAWSFIFKGGGRSARGRFTRSGGRVNAAKALTTANLSNATPRTDGSIEGAVRIKRARRGRVAYPHDANDVYKKRLRKGREYVARLRVPKGKDFDLWVWKPGTVEIWQLEAPCFLGRAGCKVAGASFRGPGKNEMVRFRARKAGMHYFQVVAWYKHRGRYRLTVRPA